MVFFCILTARWLVFHCNLKNFHFLDYENTLSFKLEFIYDRMVFLSKREQSKSLLYQNPYAGLGDWLFLFFSLFFLTRGAGEVICNRLVWRFLCYYDFDYSHCHS